MDKRTLIFVVALTAAFFAMNIFFSHQDGDEAQTLQEELRVSKQQSEFEVSVAKRTAPLEALPLVSLTSDEEGRDRLAGGVSVGDSVLALAWSEDLPQTVYVDGKALERQTENFKIEGPVIYGETLKVGVLPSQAREDLQLVVPGVEDVPPTISVAEVEGGMVTALLSPPKSAAIVLRKQGETYYPVGIYDKRFEPIALADIEKVVPEATPQDTAQQYYVLENEYQQLVFSNVGGAIAEINLPFADGIVKPIGFDRDMVEDRPTNAYFPNFAFYVPDNPELQTDRELGGYYPLLRRPLIGEDGQVMVEIPPQFYAFNTVSKYPEVANLIYEVKEFTPTSIVFEARQNRRLIRKAYTLDENVPYVLNVAVEIDGDSQNLWLTSGVPDVEVMSNRPTPALKMDISRQGKQEVSKISLPKPDQMINVTSVNPEWLSNGNGFFGILLDPLKGADSGYRADYVSGQEVPSRLVLIDSQFDRFKAPQLPGYELMVPLKRGRLEMRVFAGPYDHRILKEVDATFDTNYIHARSFHGYFAFISKPFAKFLLVIMTFFHWLTHSWGFSIILLTVVLRLMLYPLSSWSMKSIKRMQKIQPEVQKIQAKYKKDPRRSQIEVMQLYKKKKVNPFTGCLPLIIQMPFLIGMFALLKSTFALRGAGFIPGWIPNLTAPDVLFSWSQPLFFVGTEFHLLPILLGLVMFFQQRMSSTLPKDKSLWTDQQKQQKMMGNVMVGVFAVMFYNFPSGLNIYWLSSMTLGILQQWFINKQIDKQPKKNPIKA